MKNNKVTINLGGSDFELKYKFRALSAIEKHFNVPITEITEFLTNPKMNDIVVMIWAGMLHQDKTLTVNDVMDLLDDSEYTIGEITHRITSAIALSFGAEEEEETTAKTDEKKK